MKPTSTASSRHLLAWPHWLALWFGIALLSLLALPLQAAEADPPGRAGRIAETRGQVWIYATDSNEWISAVRNRPVTTGDRLSTEADGRAEVRIGSTVLHLSASTEVEVQRLDDERIDLHLLNGSVAAHLRTREAADEFGLSTDEGRFVAEGVGQYRFDRADGTSSVTASSGRARYEADGTALTVQAGQRVEFWKERGVPQYSITEPRRDDFSNWVAAENSRDERSVSSRYVSPEMTGVEDLDRYGRWEPQTEYGAVWIPRTVVAGWAPYRMGHWAWIHPWGWTWVDDAPWGFAPFHYGRWVWYRNAWCWAPGRYVQRPVYAPALVAWVGRPGVSVSVRVGSAPTVGWFPLGPREVFVPGYRVSPRYVQNVNVTHVTRITNVTTIINNPGQVVANTRYVHRDMQRAVTVVPSQVVERRQPVAPAFRPVNERTWREIRNERPRAEAPVVAPPRFEPGSPRQVVDPRVSRPGAPRPGPGRDAEAGGPRAPAVISAPRAPERDVRVPERDGREGRDGRDGRGGRDGREAPIVRPAPNTPAQPGFVGRPGVEAPPRHTQPPQPPQMQPAPQRPQQPGFSATPPQREVERVAPPRDDRWRDDRSPREDRRRPDAPPPRMQAPQPQLQPPVRQAPPPRVAPAQPPQVMRPQVQPPPREAFIPRVREEPRERPGRGGNGGNGGNGERPERGERSR